MRRIRHWKEVFKRAFIVAGWVAGVVTVIVGGSVLVGGSFLLHERHRVLAIAVFAGGVVVALLEGSYRVWDASEKQIQTAKARSGDRETAELKRAYLDVCIQEARSLIGDIAAEVVNWYG